VVGNKPTSGTELQGVGKLGSQAITRPKTIIDAMDTFFDLFKDATKSSILADVDYEGFKKIVLEKDAMPYDEANPNFDTAKELSEGKSVIERYKKSQKGL
jgi:hypothetical protein